MVYRIVVHVLLIENPIGKLIWQLIVQYYVYKIFAKISLQTNMVAVFFVLTWNGTML